MFTPNMLGSQPESQPSQQPTLNLSPLIKNRELDGNQNSIGSPVTGPYIFILLDQMTLNTIRENMFKVLQKIGTGPVTKLLHPIIEKNKFKFTAGLVNITNNQNLPSSSSLSGSKLNGFYINIYEVLEPEDRTLITTIMEVIQEINHNKSKITDNNDFILSQLVKNKNELSKELVTKINYFKLIDILYTEYLTVLVTVIKQKQNIFKIMESTSNVLGQVLSNLIQRMGGTNPDVQSITQKITLLYLIQHYSTSSDLEVKTFLYKSGLINEQEYKNFIKIKTMEDMSKYLTIAGVLNISPNSLRNNFKNVIGNVGLELLEGFEVERLIAYLVVNRKQNSIYTTFLSGNSYKANLESLETLLMNAKSYLTI